MCLEYCNPLVRCEFTLHFTICCTKYLKHLHICKRYNYKIKQRICLHDSISCFNALSKSPPQTAQPTSPLKPPVALAQGIRSMIMELQFNFYWTCSYYCSPGFWWAFQDCFSSACFVFIGEGDTFVERGEINGVHHPYRIILLAQYFTPRPFLL